MKPSTRTRTLEYQPAGKLARQMLEIVDVIQRHHAERQRRARRGTPRRGGPAVKPTRSTRTRTRARTSASAQSPSRGSPGDDDPHPCACGRSRAVWSERLGRAACARCYFGSFTAAEITEAERTDRQRSIAASIRRVIADIDAPKRAEMLADRAFLIECARSADDVLELLGEVEALGVGIARRP